MVMLAQVGRTCLGKKPIEKEAGPRGGAKIPAIQTALGSSGPDASIFYEVDSGWVFVTPDL